MDHDDGEEQPGIYYRVTLAYDVVVEGEPGEDPALIAARAVEQERLRTGTRFTAIAIDGLPAQLSVISNTIVSERE